jgi:HD superfamily phosphohydrolase
MTRPHNIWDPVWGQIELTEEEWALINTPVFQRLRRIHQLALTMLVFPGATHTRFEHSLGTLSIADRIGRRLIDLCERGESAPFSLADLRLVRLAALLHDIGHGPFSHVVDSFLGPLGHERVGALAIQHVPALRDVVEAGEPGTAAAITDVLLARGPRSIIRDIVSGPADADKIDYLVRDSHYTGVRGGHFDHDYFIDQLIGIESIGETWLGFRWNAVWSVEGLKLARYHMHRTVYGHRNRVVTDRMLDRAIHDALGTVLPADLLSVPDEARFDPWFEQYLEYDDWRVFTLGLQAPGLAGAMFKRLRDHRLLKVLVFLEGEDLRKDLGPAHARILATRKDHFEAGIEAELAADLGFDPGEVIVYLLNPDHVLHTDPLRLDNDINFVRAGPGDMAQLTERSEIFSAQPAERWRRQLVVYAPTGTRESPELAAKAKAKTLELLRAALEEGR